MHYNTIENNSESLLQTNKEIVLEVNTGGTKHMNLI
jgi:hypothetical protein